MIESSSTVSPSNPASGVLLSCDANSWLGAAGAGLPPAGGGGGAGPPAGGGGGAGLLAAGGGGGAEYEGDGGGGAIIEIEGAIDERLKLCVGIIDICIGIAE